MLRQVVSARRRRAREGALLSAVRGGDGVGRLPATARADRPLAAACDDGAANVAARGTQRRHHTATAAQKAARPHCRYQPAGHVEPGETITAAVQRELREECGYDGDVLQLLSVEVRGSGWFRMAYACEVSGGELKTRADEESLGAAWFDVEDIREGRVGAWAFRVSAAAS